MLALYGLNDVRLQPLGEGARIADAVWADLFMPAKEEEAAVESAIGLDVPTREEMGEIELSARLYIEGEAAFMTANILSRTDDAVVASPITFILAGEQLVTVRYQNPRAFGAVVERGQRAAIGCTSADAILVCLLEAVVERLADTLERVAHDIDGLSQLIFRPPPAAPAAEEESGKGKRRSARQSAARDFQKILEDIGRKGDLTSNIRDSLVSLQRLLTFLAHVSTQRKPGKDVQARVKTLIRDGQALSDHASFLSQKITFLLDATLGMINIEQNATIKIFSVVAVIFLPPTLIASIYGMNFRFMPELNWPLGYPFAVAIMILSAILPYLFFKRRGWL